MHDTPARTATVADSTSATFTAAGVRRGMALAIPFGGSSLIYGLGFGVLASQMGLSVAEAVVMGALVFSGTAQFAVVQAWGTGPALVAVFATVLVANARYFLMSAALRPWLGSLGRVNAVTALVTVRGEHTWTEPRERDHGRCRIDPDRVRQDDRSVLPRKLHTRAVRALRNDRAGIVEAVPLHSHPAAGERPCDQAAHDRVAPPDDVDLDPVARP